ncbi:MAG: hypothetical protein ABGZ36_19805, partial [Actinomycetota bacterium]
MKVELDRAPGGGSSTGVGVLDPVDAVVAKLRQVDRLMAEVLRGIQQAGGVSRDGLPARRLIGLAADVTGAEAGVPGAVRADAVGDARDVAGLRPGLPV